VYILTKGLKNPYILLKLHELSIMFKNKQKSYSCIKLDLLHIIKIIIVQPTNKYIGDLSQRLYKSFMHGTLKLKYSGNILVNLIDLKKHIHSGSNCKYKLLIPHIHHIAEYLYYIKRGSIIHASKFITTIIFNSFSTSKCIQLLDLLLNDELLCTQFISANYLQLYPVIKSMFLSALNGNYIKDGHFIPFIYITSVIASKTYVPLNNSTIYKKQIHINKSVVIQRKTIPMIVL